MSVGRAVLLGASSILLAILPITPATAALWQQAGRITLMVSGSGPDVVLIPGLACSANVWRPLATRLRSHFRVHIVQLSGFGGIPAGANSAGAVVDPSVDALHAYLARRHIHRAAIIGHSLGGVMAMKLALRYPADVGRLLLIESVPFFGLISDGPNASVASVTPEAARLRDETQSLSPPDWGSWQVARMARLTKSSNTASARAIRDAIASDPHVIAQAIFDSNTTDLRQEIADIRVPTTMIYAYDPAKGRTRADVEGIYRREYSAMSQIKFVRIENSFHFVMIDQPDATLRAIRRFLDLSGRGQL